MPARRFASGPVTCEAAGRGHRRGLDGPSMPKPLKWSECFSAPTWVSPATRWMWDRCAGSPGRRGALVARGHVSGRPATPALTGAHLTERPSEAGRPGRVQAHVIRSSNPASTSALACGRRARSEPCRTSAKRTTPDRIASTCRAPKKQGRSLAAPALLPVSIRLSLPDA